MLTLLLFAPLKTIAESSNLKGTVTDKSGRPLPGAVIEIPDLKVGAVTDSVGNYEITELPHGNFIVLASFISYAKKTAAIHINGDARLDFILSESAIESKEVVITGQSKATEINRSPVPVVAINEKYLKENASSNIIDAISRVPGVSAVTTGPNVSKPFIRGLGYNRVLTLYNGMRQEGQQWGDEHGIEIDEFSIDRIELVKGPASLLYGSDAIAGVVNLIPAAPPAAGKIDGGLATEYQSNNRLIGASGFLAGNQNGFAWQGRVSHKQAVDYQNSIDGRVYGTNFAETDANAALGWYKKWGFTQLDVSMFDDQQAVPDGSRDSSSRKFTRQITEADTSRPIVPENDLISYKLPVLHQHVQLYRVMATNNFHVFNGTLALNAGFERSVRREFSHPLYPDLAGLYLELNSYTYDVKYYFHHFLGCDIITGVNGMYQTNDVTKGTEFVIPSYRQFDLGPFLIFKKNSGKLDIAGGIRYDSRTFGNDDFYSVADPVTGFGKYAPNYQAGAEKLFGKYDHTFTGVTYSFGLTCVFSKYLAIKGNAARGFRAPNIFEISANGVHPGTNIYQLGNPDFKPEFSLQEDIGLEFSSAHVSVNISIFNNDIANYIYNQKLVDSKGLDSVIIPGNQTFQFRASNARLYGGELAIDIHPHPLDWLHFENSVSFVQAINEGINGVKPNDSARYLPFIPPLHGTSEFRADFRAPSKHLKNSFAKLQLVVYAKQDHAYLAYNTETATPAYYLLNAGIGTDIEDRKGRTVINIGLFANNVLDAAYQDHLNRLKYFEPFPSDHRGHTGIYNMGRNIGIKISVPLRVK